MANQIKLYTPDKKVIYTWNNAIIDSVHSHTTILPGRKGAALFTLTDERTKIHSTTLHVDIYFKSGYFFRIYIQ